MSGSRRRSYAGATHRNPAALLLALALAPAAAAPAQVQVGEPELVAARADAGRAGGLLSAAWRDILERANRFPAPNPALGDPDDLKGVIGYRDAHASPCHTLGSENAFYCRQDDTIYYDEWFVAALKGLVAQELETDGDFAVFAVLAHEWGHRIRARLRPGAAAIPALEELGADCLAGAALREISRRAAVSPGDSAEALLAVRMLGDAPDPEPSRPAALRHPGPAPGDPASPGRAQRGLTRHGDPDERVRSFRRGLGNGAGKCMKELREP